MKEGPVFLEMSSLGEASKKPAWYLHLDNINAL